MNFLLHYSILIAFQITITPYQKEVEPNVPDKRQIMEAVKETSQRLGKENVKRYDLIVITEKYSLDYHKKCLKNYAIHFI